MPELVTDCPRCKAKKMTFDLVSAYTVTIYYDWQKEYETFCICRACNKTTTFVLKQKNYNERGILKEGLVNISGAVNRYLSVEGYINLKNFATKLPPEHLPGNIEAVFREGAACMAISCFNAAGTMFRLCIDLVTRSILPEDGTEGLNAKTRRDLGLRLPWLFNNNLLPKELEYLSSCIKEDGNDGAHAGSLTKDDAEDLLDFTYEFLERIYTEPKRLLLAKERRDQRRKKPDEAETES